MCSMHLCVHLCLYRLVGLGLPYTIFFVIHLKCVAKAGDGTSKMDGCSKIQHLISLYNMM